MRGALPAGLEMTGASPFRTGLPEELLFAGYAEAMPTAREGSEVWIPDHVLQTLLVEGEGTLRGYVHERGASVVATLSAPAIGVASCDSTPECAPSSARVWIGLSGTPTACVRDDASWHSAVLRVYDPNSTAFARHQGLVRLSVLAERRILVVGVGSVGSYVAAHLCRQGVGAFDLLDSGVFTPENVARHLLDQRSIGRHKARAVAEALLAVNPEVDAVPMVANALDPLAGLEAAIDRSDLVVCAADSILVRRVVNAECVARNKPAIFVGFYANAVASEVIFVIPGSTACLACVHGSEGVDDVVSSANVPYAGASGEPGEPGLSIDIATGVNVACSLALAILDPRGERAKAFHTCYSRVMSHAFMRPTGVFSGDFVEPGQTRWVATHRAGSCSVCGHLPMRTNGASLAVGECEGEPVHSVSPESATI